MSAGSSATGSVVEGVSAPIGGVSLTSSSDSAANSAGSVERALSDVSSLQATARSEAVATKAMRRVELGDGTPWRLGGSTRREGPVDDIGIEVQREPTPTARRLHDALAVAAEEV